MRWLERRRGGTEGGVKSRTTPVDGRRVLFLFVLLHRVQGIVRGLDLELNLNRDFITGFSIGHMPPFYMKPFLIF